MDDLPLLRYSLPGGEHRDGGATTRQEDARTFSSPRAPTLPAVTTPTGPHNDGRHAPQLPDALPSASLSPSPTPASQIPSQPLASGSPRDTGEAGHPKTPRPTLFIPYNSVSTAPMGSRSSNSTADVYSPRTPTRNPTSSAEATRGTVHEVLSQMAPAFRILFTPHVGTRVRLDGAACDDAWLWLDHLGLEAQRAVQVCLTHGLVGVIVRESDPRDALDFGGGQNNNVSTHNTSRKAAAASTGPAKASGKSQHRKAKPVPQRQPQHQTPEQQQQEHQTSTRTGTPWVVVKFRIPAALAPAFFKTPHHRTAKSRASARTRDAQSQKEQEVSASLLSSRSMPSVSQPAPPTSSSLGDNCLLVAAAPALNASLSAAEVPNNDSSIKDPSDSQNHTDQQGVKEAISPADLSSGSSNRSMRTESIVTMLSVASSSDIEEAVAGKPKSSSMNTSGSGSGSTSTGQSALPASLPAAGPSEAGKVGGRSARETDLDDPLSMPSQPLSAPLPGVGLGPARLAPSVSSHHLPNTTTTHTHTANNVNGVTANPTLLSLCNQSVGHLGLPVALTVSVPPTAPAARSLSGSSLFAQHSHQGPLFRLVGNESGDVGSLSSSQPRPRPAHTMRPHHSGSTLITHHGDSIQSIINADRQQPRVSSSPPPSATDDGSTAGSVSRVEMYCGRFANDALPLITPVDESLPAADDSPRTSTEGKSATTMTTVTTGTSISGDTHSRLGTGEGCGVVGGHAALASPATHQHEQQKLLRQRCPRTNHFPGTSAVRMPRSSMTPRAMWGSTPTTRATGDRWEAARAAPAPALPQHYTDGTSGADDSDDVVVLLRLPRACCVSLLQFDLAAAGVLLPVAHALAEPTPSALASAFLMLDDSPSGPRAAQEGSKWQTLHDLHHLVNFFLGRLDRCTTRLDSMPPLSTPVLDCRGGAFGSCAGTKLLQLSSAHAAVVKTEGLLPPRGGSDTGVRCHNAIINNNGDGNAEPSLSKSAVAIAAALVAGTVHEALQLGYDGVKQSARRRDVSPLANHQLASLFSLARTTSFYQQWKKAQGECDQQRHGHARQHILRTWESISSQSTSVATRSTTTTQVSVTGASSLPSPCAAALLRSGHGLAVAVLPLQALLATTVFSERGCAVDTCMQRHFAVAQALSHPYFSAYPPAAPARQQQTESAEEDFPFAQSSTFVWREGAGQGRPDAVATAEESDSVMIDNLKDSHTAVPPLHHTIIVPAGEDIDQGVDALEPLTTGRDSPASTPALDEITSADAGGAAARAILSAVSATARSRSVRLTVSAAPCPVAFGVPSSPNTAEPASVEAISLQSETSHNTPHHTRQSFATASSRASVASSEAPSPPSTWSRREASPPSSAVLHHHHHWEPSSTTTTPTTTTKRTFVTHPTASPLQDRLGGPALAREGTEAVPALAKETITAAEGAFAAVSASVASLKSQIRLSSWQDGFVFGAAPLEYSSRLLRLHTTRPAKRHDVVFRESAPIVMPFLCRWPPKKRAASPCLVTTTVSISPDSSPQRSPLSSATTVRDEGRYREQDEFGCAPLNLFRTINRKESSSILASQPPRSAATDTLPPTRTSSARGFATAHTAPEVCHECGCACTNGALPCWLSSQRKTEKEQEEEEASASCDARYCSPRCQHVAWHFHHFAECGAVNVHHAQADCATAEEQTDFTDVLAAVRRAAQRARDMEERLWHWECAPHDREALTPCLLLSVISLRVFTRILLRTVAVLCPGITRAAAPAASRSEEDPIPEEEAAVLKDLADTRAAIVDTCLADFGGCQTTSPASGEKAATTAASPPPSPSEQLLLAEHVLQAQGIPFFADANLGHPLTVWEATRTLPSFGGNDATPSAAAGNTGGRGESTWSPSCASPLPFGNPSLAATTAAEDKFAIMCAIAPTVFDMLGGVSEVIETRRARHQGLPVPGTEPPAASPLLLLSFLGCPRFADQLWDFAVSSFSVVNGSRGRRRCHHRSSAVRKRGGSAVSAPDNRGNGVGPSEGESDSDTDSFFDEEDDTTTDVLSATSLPRRAAAASTASSSSLTDTGAAALQAASRQWRRFGVPVVPTVVVSPFLSLVADLQQYSPENFYATRFFPEHAERGRAALMAATSPHHLHHHQLPWGSASFRVGGGVGSGLGGVNAADQSSSFLSINSVSASTASMATLLPDGTRSFAEESTVMGGGNSSGGPAISCYFGQERCAFTDALDSGGQNVEVRVIKQQQHDGSNTTGNPLFLVVARAAADLVAGETLYAAIPVVSDE